MDIVVYVHAASNLKNVNWRHGSLKAYAVAWIDSSAKCSTKTDPENGVNPFWDEKLTIAIPETSDPETAVLHIDIVHANHASDTKPLVGSAKLPLKVALDEAQAKGKAWFDLILERTSGRPQGNLKIKIKISKSDNSKWETRGKQPHASSETQPQPQPYNYQSQYHTTPQPPMHQYYPNTSHQYAPGYPPYSSQAARPNPAQAPGYASGIEDIQGTARASESLDAAYAKARLAARGRMYALNLI